MEKTVCATITLPEGKYVAGTKILQAADGETITQDLCGKFAVSQDGWEIVPNDDGVAGVLGIVSQ